MNIKTWLTKSNDKYCYNDQAKDNWQSDLANLEFARIFCHIIIELEI